MRSLYTLYYYNEIFNVHIASYNTLLTFDFIYIVTLLYNGLCTYAYNYSTHIATITI